MIGAKHLFAARQRAFMERACSRKITLDLKQGCKIAEAVERTEMLGTERPFEYCKRAFLQ